MRNVVDGSASRSRQVRLPRHRLQLVTRKLQSFHKPPPAPPPQDIPITVVCISNTHNTQPPLPPSDLLLHAGDLTEWGTFAEIQAQMTWLSQQPHKHKVLIAGNHDLLLDKVFEHKHPERWQQALEAASGDGARKVAHKSAEDLDWGDIIYLENTSTKLAIGSDERQINIFGSPLTHEHGNSAFQYPKGTDPWTEAIPAETDILLTHGPPWGHLDGVKKAGCPYLTTEVMRARPRLVVFGHIHIGYGQEERVYDRAGCAHEEIMMGYGGWASLAVMATAILRGWLIPSKLRRSHARTKFVNAAVVEGFRDYKVKNKAIVLSL